MENINNISQEILILHDSLGGGGAEKALIEILQRFDYTKYHVTLILFVKRGVHLSSIPKQVELESLYPSGNRLFFEKIICRTSFKWKYEKNKLLKLCGNKRYYAIISFMEGPGAMMHNYLKDNSSNNITWVHSDVKMHHWTSRYFANLKYESDFYKSANHIICVSDDVKNAIKSTYDLSSKISVIQNIIDTKKVESLATELKLSKKAFTVCYIGRLVEVKRPDRFIEMIAILRERNIYINGWIIGLGTKEMESKLEKMASILGVNDQINFYGFQKNPYPYLKNADLLIISSDAEGDPVIMREAFALGTAIVATKCGGVQCALKDGTGMLTDFSPKSLADAVELLYNNNDKLQEYRNMSLKKREENDPDKIMEQISQIIEL